MFRQIHHYSLGHLFCYQANTWLPQLKNMNLKLQDETEAAKHEPQAKCVYTVSETSCILL